MSQEFFFLPCRCNGLFCFIVTKWKICNFIVTVDEVHVHSVCLYLIENEIIGNKI